MFEEFIVKHGKAYKNDLKEKVHRFKIFSRNLEKIKLLNQHEQASAVYGITEFTDLTYEEFTQTKLGLKMSNDQDPLIGGQLLEPSLYEEKDSVPDSWDWRQVNGVVTPVKNQGMCGSCWAFSTTGNVEGVWAVKRNQSVSLSEQELVDCDKLDNGCAGGLPSNAYKSIIQLGGLETEGDYPYKGENEKCAFKRNKTAVTIDSYVELPKDEVYMKNHLYKNGPISIGINANAMQFYFGGISHPPSWMCSSSGLNHGVLIVGYGVGKTSILRKTQPYWIIKNSWGKGYGEQVN